MTGPLRNLVSGLTGALALSLTLSACVPGDEGAAFLAAPPAAGQGVRTVRVFAGAVRIRAPEGYCVDQQASREETGFVVMAACNRVAGIAVAPATQGLVTVQVGGPGSAVVRGSEDALIALLQSPEGSAMLSGSGTASDITVKRAEAHQGVVEVIFADRAAPPVNGLDRQEFRAFLDLRGRLVTLRLRGYDENPLSDRAGLGLLRQSVQSLIDANP